MNKSAWLALGTAAGLMLLSGSALTHDNNNDPRPTIQGAWQVEATLRVDGPDCTIAAIVGTGVNPFRALNTFHEGGTMNEWGTRSPPATRGVGSGVWERTGHNKYRYRLLFHSFDANGLLTATMDIRTDLKLARDGDTFEGVSRFLRTDISGNAIRFCATMNGERISL